MKKLILIFGVFSIICVIVSSVAESRVNSANVTTETVSASENENLDIFTVRSENGKIVVYKGDTMHLKTDTAVSTLPKPDQKILLYGINANSKEELDKILEQYCS